MITPNILLALNPNLSSKAGIYTGVLNQAMDRFGIDTPKHMAHFLGQTAVESGGFTLVRENLNYSAERLMVVWPRRFPTLASTEGYAHNPQALANKVYANRMGNGDEASNDGWNTRGAGWIQLTGKTNQETCAHELGVSPADIGAWLATSAGAAQSAAWFWWKNRCNALVDTGSIDAVSDAINLGRQTEKVGDAEGYAKRVQMTNLALKALQA